MCVDLGDSLPRNESSVPHPRIHCVVWVEALLEGGDDNIVRWVGLDIILEPPDDAGKTHGRVDRLGVGNVLKDPADTTRIVCVPFPKVLQIPRRHQ